MRFKITGVLFIFFITLSLGYAQTTWLPQSDEKLQKNKKIVTEKVIEIASQYNYFDLSYVNKYVDGLMNSINQNNGQGVIIAHDTRRWCKVTFTLDNDKIIKMTLINHDLNDFGRMFKHDKIDQSEWPNLIKQFNTLGYAVTTTVDGNVKYYYNFEENRFMVTFTRQNKELLTRPVIKDKIQNVQIAKDDRFIAYDNGTVLDTKTNLMWAVNDGSKEFNRKYFGSYYQNYSGGGYTDWRIPTQDELMGLYDQNKTYETDCLIKVHLTELIHLSCAFVCASKTIGADQPFLDFNSGKLRRDPWTVGDCAELPVRSSYSTKENY